MQLEVLEKARCVIQNVVLQRRNDFYKKNYFLLDSIGQL